MVQASSSIFSMVSPPVESDGDLRPPGLGGMATSKSLIASSLGLSPMLALRRTNSESINQSLPSLVSWTVKSEA